MPHRKTLNLLVTAVASVLSRVSGVVTVLIAGWYLTKDDFGVFAIATGVSTLTLFLRGGGSGLLLQTMAPAEFGVLGGAMFRVACLFGAIGGALTLLAIPIAGAQYSDVMLGGTSGLASSLIGLASAALLYQISTFPRAKAAAQFRFEALAVVDIIAAITKLVVAVVCARSGWGPATLGAAQATASGVQLLGCVVISGVSRADLSVQPDWIPSTWKLIKVPLLLSVLITVSTQIDTLVASLFVPVATLGIYFFAANLASAPISLVVGSLKSVLAPYAARARGNPGLERTNLEATFAAGTVFVPLALMMMATVYPSLSHLIWGQKWNDSIWPVIIGAALLIYPTIQGLLEGPVIGLRVWREYLSILAWRVACRAIGAVAAIVVVRWFALDAPATAIALTIGVGVPASVIAFIQIRSLMYRYKMDPQAVDFELHSPTIYAVVGLVATRGVIASVMDSKALLGAAGVWASLLEFVLAFGFFGLIAILLLRLNYLGKLLLLVSLMPAPIRQATYRVLMVKPEAVRGDL